MKIKVREITEGCKFEMIKKGEWIDLRAAEAVDLKAPQYYAIRESHDGGITIDNSKITFDYVKIPLGIAMSIPDGFEAHVLPRSSTFSKFKIILSNSQGIIDSSYSGNDDQWKYEGIALNKTHINKGDRICQFRIELSQKANIWQRLKWLFTNKIKFEWVDKLDGPNRGGFGSTGIK